MARAEEQYLDPHLAKLARPKRSGGRGGANRFRNYTADNSQWIRSFISKWMPAPTEEHRIILDFTQPAIRELGEMKALMGTTSGAKVIQESLGWTLWTIRALQGGGKILLRARTGEIREIILPFSQQAEI